MIIINQVSVQYGNRTLFKDVTLKITPKDKIGLVGRNGAGKSTLLKLIDGRTTPDSGKLEKTNNTTIGYLEQEITFSTGNTVLEEAKGAFPEIQELFRKVEDINNQLTTRTDYESDSYMQLLNDLDDFYQQINNIGGYDIEERIERILKGLGFLQSDMQKPMNQFSGGWQMRLVLAKLLLQQPQFLLLDEPTNHLDIESIIWLEGFLKTYEGSVILISHDKTFLDNVTNKTVEIELGNIYQYSAPYTKYLTLKEERREMMESAAKNQEKDIKQTKELINKFRAKKNKAKFAQSLIKKLDKMDVIELENEDASKMKLRFLPVPRSGLDVLKVTNLDKSYGELDVLKDINLLIERGEKVAFVGQNGQGKSTLAKIIVGEEGSTNGDSILGHNVEMGYFAQNQAETLDPKKTVLETLDEAATGELRTKVRSILGSFLFSGEDVEKKISVLSGGERNRLALAKLMLKPINLLIVDEPTNHLDITSKEVLKEALANYEGTMIAISHDRDFLSGLTEKTIEFKDKNIRVYDGDINYFLEKRQVETFRAFELDKEKNTKQKSSKPQNSKETQKAVKKLKNDVNKIEKKIERFEKEIAELEKTMGEPNFYMTADYEATVETHQKKKTSLSKVMEEWETVQMELDGLES